MVLVQLYMHEVRQYCNAINVLEGTRGAHRHGSPWSHPERPSWRQRGSQSAWTLLAVESQMTSLWLRTGTLQLMTSCWDAAAARTANHSSQSQTRSSLPWLVIYKSYVRMYVSVQYFPGYRRNVSGWMSGQSGCVSCACQAHGSTPRRT
jgi:hypothetical protein